MKENPEDEEDDEAETEPFNGPTTLIRGSDKPDPKAVEYIDSAMLRAEPDHAFLARYFESRGIHNAPTQLIGFVAEEEYYDQKTRTKTVFK